MAILSIALHSNSGVLPNKAIELMLGDDDWIRLYSGRFYFLNTEKSPSLIYNEVTKVLPDQDLMFIATVPIAFEFAARIPTEAWDWLQKYFPDIVRSPMGQAL